jgi:hypothetical protein
MKLSSETIDVLKNFSNINQNILIKEGDKVRTMSTMKNILAQASITEAFPRDFGIYDLTEFLGVMSLVGDPELEFNDSYLTINGGGAKIKYFFSDPSILISPPDTFNAPDTDVQLNISQDTLSNVLKASAVMQLPDVVINKIQGDVPATVSVADLKNPTSNSFSEKIDDRATEAFNFNFKAENLKVIPGNYDVSVSSQALVSHWTNTVKDVDYWIALEQPSD